MLGGICLMSFYLFICSFLSVMKKNVSHSIEQRTIDASTDQRHSRFKYANVRRRTL